MSLNEFKDVLISSKKYWLIYLVLIIVLGLSTITYRSVLDPTYEIYIFLIVAVLGILCIVYYFMHNSDKELYKVAFVIILCFGICASFIVPICDVSDETEHLARVELTSRGIIIPHWTGEDLGVDRAYNVSVGHKPVVYNKGAGFVSIEALNDLTVSLGRTVFHTPYDSIKIDYTPTIIVSAFEQNPFYGYLPQAIGMDIAKLLDLNVIWMLWLGRIFNLIFYAGLISLAIRRTPVLKMPILAVSCIPISIYQAASLSIDSMIIGLAILAIAYFLSLYKAEKNSLGVKEVVVFSALCLILGLCKLPYLAFIFFLLLIPFDNFEKGKKIIPYMILCIALVGIMGVMWSRYSEPALMHSWRSRLRYLDPTGQMNYVLSHPGFIGNFFAQIFTYNIAKILYGMFNFFGAAQRVHYADSYHLVVATLLLFLAVMLLAYPKKVKFDKKTRLGTLLIVLMIYVGTCFIQLLTWASVGKLNLGLSARYFVPLFALFPVIGTFRIGQLERFKDNIDKYAMVFIIAFMAVMILSFATKYY
ncbi:DUF2142 domain-containing protein [Methanobrevibacter sp.]|uniref:DUF2142 domain-containing protein n=1 Tax=Methanobrevibacter sp. TaxID=66852 RepID=UPI002E78F5A2|nr:DUF2142 domain-containing protein [Methanobrevibacter sp.]MEE0938755.1 DUF2142 domain-containing protein [Methanobrevibacter sp.]